MSSCGHNMEYLIKKKKKFNSKQKLQSLMFFLNKKDSTKIVESFQGSLPGFAGFKTVCSQFNSSWGGKRCRHDAGVLIIVFTCCREILLGSVGHWETLLAGSSYMVMKSIGPMCAPIRSLWFICKGLWRGVVAWQPPNEMAELWQF